ncbi:MAG TPA: ABC transporter permease [Pyrinomonadaceae bacterium]|nr:ABC transporter permease [Pyrinomonadaceae bacterium]
MNLNKVANQYSSVKIRGRPIRIIRPVSFSPLDLLRELRGLWHYRDLFYTLTVHRIKVRYKQSILGLAWAILQPLSLMLIYTVIFSVVAKVSSEGVPYAVFAYAALLPWTFFSSSLTNATQGLVSHTQLVTKVYFAREILPLTYVSAALFDFVVASSFLFALFLYYRVSITIYALWAIPILVLLATLATAFSLFFSALQVRFRDVGVAMPLLLQLWMFASPVVYPLSAVPQRLRGAYALNPTVGVIENFRRVVLQGVAPDFYSLGVSALLAAILLPLAYLFFKRVEATMADVI